MTSDVFAVRGCLRAAIAPASSGHPTPRASTADAPRPAVATIVAPDEASHGHREPTHWLRLAQSICTPLYRGPDLEDGPTADELNGEIACYLQYTDAHPETRA